MKTNEAGLDLIKAFEGCRLTAYKDQGNIWTIGVGHTGADVYEGLVIDQEQADDLLADDLTRTEDGVNALVTCKHLSANQYSAIVCFTYNVGIGNLRASLLLRCINMGNLNDAAMQFERWDHIKGIPNAGLLRRRQAERALFLTD